jgi:hypothetical protein
MPSISATRIHASKQSRSSLRYLAVFVALAVIYIGTRVYALTIMPLHFDEEVHLTRAIEVWRGHPFWDISDGRVVNQWAIAAFYPQNAPVFVSRIATILVSLTGFAAGYALARRWFGPLAGFIAGISWLTCPYLFFYERTALIDAEAGALAVVAIWASLRLVTTGRRRDAALTGLALATALLFKFTAIPFVFSVGLIVCFLGKIPWRQRLVNLVLIGLVMLACFAVPLIYAARHQGFSVVTGWLIGSGGQGLSLAWNLEVLQAQLIGYGTLVWSVLLGVGLIGIVTFIVSPSIHLGNIRTRRDTILLLLASMLPLAIILIMTKFVMPRHIVVAVPILIVLLGSGLGILVEPIAHAQAPFTWLGLARTGAVLGLLMLGIIPFAQTAYTAPDTLTLPLIERQQYLTGYSAGFGLREAVLDFPHTVGKVGIPIIASMYPDGCRLANFYDTWGYNMHCTDAPALNAIQSAMAAQPTNSIVYVLAEAQPIGLDPAWFKTLVQVKITRIAGYPRPGETPETASITLWRLEKLGGS